MTKRPNVRVCMNCNGAGRVWNPKTRQNDLICTACGGSGKIVISTI